MPSSGKQKDLMVLRKIIEKDGYKVVPSGSGHWRVLTNKGAVIVDENGPVILSGTTSEFRGRDMAVHRLMKAGVLKRDPWAPTAKKTEDDQAPDPDEMSEQERAVYEAEQEEARRTNQERSRRTFAVRERIEPVIARLGGWDKRGMLTEIGTVAHYFATQSRLPDAWTSPQAAAENARALSKGATLSDPMATIWERLMTELESWPDTQLRWMQLLREAKGLEEPTIGEAVTPLERGLQVVQGGGAVVPLPKIEGMPTLALRAMFEMGVGRAAHDPDRATCMKIGEEIMRLEILARDADPSDAKTEEANDDDGES